MKHTLLTITLISAPALLAAQQSGQSSATASQQSSASASASASVSANAQGDVSIPDNYSAHARERITTAFRSARAKHVPDEQMRKRMAEGQARGATDVQVASAVMHTEARLEASQALLMRAGRQNPQAEEVNNAELAMERGATDAQIVATAQHPPANVSVAAALSALAQSGTPGKSAAAGEVGAAVSAAAGGANGSAGANAAAHAGSAVGGVAGGVSGSVAGAVGAKRP